MGLILVLLTAYFIRKSRRLEHSMFALMSRRTADDDGGVTFHSGIDLVMILLHVNYDHPGECSPEKDID